MTSIMGPCPGAPVAASGTRFIKFGTCALVAASGTQYIKFGTRALLAASGTRFIKFGTRVRKKRNVVISEKVLYPVGSSSRLVHPPGKKALDLLHGVVSLFEVRLEDLTPS